MTIRVVAVPSVRSEAIRALMLELDSSNAPWAHVTATASLERVFRSAGLSTISIVNLIDLIVDAHSPLDGGPPYPRWDSSPAKMDHAIGEWRAARKGPQVERAISFDEAMRVLLADALAEGDAAARVLLRSRRQFRESLESLAASGFCPSHFSGADPLPKLASSTWASLEEGLPELTNYRRVLWEGALAPDVAMQVMDHALGSSAQLMYHGFHFFTPPQWALVQRIEESGIANQVFVVHDEPREPAFEVWRRFFSGRWNLPRPEVVEVPAHDRSIGADALGGALSGRRVDAAALEGKVSVWRCQSPASLVELWRTEESDGEEAPLRYAANPRSLAQFQKRLSGDGQERLFDLAQLPVGVYILGLHRCIRVDSGQPTIELAADVMADIVASGYLQVDGQPTHSLAPIFERALPYFRRCRSDVDWLTRAAALESVVLQEVSPRGGRDPEAPPVDRARLAASNYLRLVPWGDLATSEATQVRKIVETIVSAVRALAAAERRTLGVHWATIRGQLEQSMKALGETEVAQISSRLAGFHLRADEPIHIEGLIDAISMLLGRQADSPVAESDEQETGVGGFHTLDALAFIPADRPVHVANFADGLIPSRAKVVGWPFELAQLANGPEVAREILSLRAQTAALSDLYLFWLALDGTFDTTLTFSWIAERSGDFFGPSPLLALLTAPSVGDAALSDRLGGIRIRDFVRASSGGSGNLTVGPVPPDDPAELTVTESEFAAPARGAAHLCRRRFAIQWVLGDSHSFTAEHHWSLLYGNVRGALADTEHDRDPDEIADACDDLWTPLTSGERATSYTNRVIGPDRGRGAPPAWAFFLKGARSGLTAMDRGYQTALDRTSNVTIALPEDGQRFLPAGVSDPDVCQHCPIKVVCREAAF